MSSATFAKPLILHIRAIRAIFRKARDEAKSGRCAAAKRTFASGTRRYKRDLYGRHFTIPEADSLDDVFLARHQASRALQAAPCRADRSFRGVRR